MGGKRTRGDRTVWMFIRSADWRSVSTGMAGSGFHRLQAGLVRGIRSHPSDRALSRSGRESPGGSQRHRRCALVRRHSLGTLAHATGSNFEENSRAARVLARGESHREARNVTGDRRLRGVTRSGLWPVPLVRTSKRTAARLAFSRGESHREARDVTGDVRLCGVARSGLWPMPLVRTSKRTAARLAFSLAERVTGRLASRSGDRTARWTVQDRRLR